METVYNEKITDQKNNSFQTNLVKAHHRNLKVGASEKFKIKFGVSPLSQNEISKKAEKTLQMSISHKTEGNLKNSYQITKLKN